MSQSNRVHVFTNLSEIRFNIILEETYGFDSRVIYHPEVFFTCSC